ncbi:MAG: hypothetical protein IKW33_01505 [Clostridia bacterium]|nr:hypothetical protein [Clostridia bacterium]
MFWNKSKNNNSEDAIKNAFAPTEEQNQQEKGSTLTGASSKNKGFVDNGVIVGYENFIDWQKNSNRAQIYKGMFAGIGKEEAVKIGILALNTNKELEKTFGKRALKQLIKEMKGYQPLLEFQPILEVKLNLTGVNYTFDYQNKNVKSETSGERFFALNSGYHGYYTTYITSHTPNDNIAKYKDVEPKSAVEYVTEDPRHVKPTPLNDVRFRVEPSRYEHVVQTAKDKILNGAKKFAVDKAKTALAKDNKWTASKLNCVCKTLSYENFRVEETYVPFWFFSTEVDKINITARVNAVTKDVDVVAFNPYCQFDEKDDVAKSAVNNYIVYLK